MKLTVAVVVFLTGTAAAGKVTLQPVPAVDSPPTVVGSYAVCKDASSHVRTARLDVQGHEIDILHDCDQTHVQIALQSKAGWHLFTTGGPGGETSTFATIKKGTRALLHRTDTSIENADNTYRRHSRIDICAFDSKDVPSCGSVEVDCPETGCKAPEILKGALWLHAKGGRQKLTIEYSK